MHSTPLDAQLSACDREPIRIPGSIQPHGFLLALSASEHTIVQISSNTPTLLALPPEKLLGQTLDTLLPENAMLRLQQSLDKLDQDGKMHYLRAISFDSARYFDMLAHGRDGLILIEFEPVERPVADFSLLYPLLNNFLSQANDSTSVVAMSQLACAGIKRLTGFGRSSAQSACRRRAQRAFGAPATVTGAHRGRSEPAPARHGRAGPRRGA